MREFCVLILAAGKGTRMASRRAKVLHEVAGVPMIRLAIRSAAALAPDAILVVVGQDAEQVKASAVDLPVEFVLQEEQLGTGHAVLCAGARLAERSGDVLVLYGDTPRIRSSTLEGLLRHHRASGAATTILTTCPPDPFGYGRVLRDSKGKVHAIVEQKDASEAQRAIREINSGIYCFRIGSLLSALKELRSDNLQGEYYLTDVVRIQARSGLPLEAVLHPDAEELQGINCRWELAAVSKVLWRERAASAMAAGVTLLDPETVYIGPEVRFETDVTIHPNVTLDGACRIEQGSVIRQGCRVVDSWIGPDVEVRDGCLIAGSRVGRGTILGPFAHVRDHSVIGESCRICTSVEIARCSIGDGTSAAHQAFLGDAEVGNGVTIGAGVITCNFDGREKRRTVIEDGAFIGTDSQLVAPVRIGRRAFVAAGSCVVRDVPAAALAISRARQVHRRGWAGRRSAIPGPSRGAGRGRVRRSSGGRSRSPAPGARRRSSRKVTSRS